MIIGLCGYGRSGKDSVGKALKHQGFKRYAFADAVRALALDLNPWVRVISDDGVDWVRLGSLVGAVDWENAKSQPDVREFLQHLGTDIREKLDPYIWLDKVIERLTEDQPEHAVITDVRFPNEAEWINKVGHLVEVVRPGVGPVNSHHSEAYDLSEWIDYTFLNHHGLDELITMARRLPDHLEQQR